MHTPGPWKTDRQYPWCVKSRTGHIASVSLTGFQPATPAERIEVCANARLIAAAPELKASLVELTEWMRSNLGPRDGIHDMLVRAVNVLAKTEK